MIQRMSENDKIVTMALRGRECCLLSRGDKKLLDFESKPAQFLRLPVLARGSGELTPGPQAIKTICILRGERRTD
jgi:hypothetical protein